MVLKLTRCLAYFRLCFTLFKGNNYIYPAELPGAFVAKCVTVYKMLTAWASDKCSINGCNSYH